MEYGEQDKLFEPDRVARPNRDRLREDGCLERGEADIDVMTSWRRAVGTQKIG